MEQKTQRRITNAQLRLLEAKKAALEVPRPADAGPADDLLANGLAGIRLVLCAALLAGGLTEARREELERAEREAWDLLREATNALIY